MLYLEPSSIFAFWWSILVVGSGSSQDWTGTGTVRSPVWLEVVVIRRPLCFGPG